MDLQLTKHFLAFDFCRFCVVIRGFHPRHNGCSIPDFIYYINVPVLILEKEPFLMFSAEQGHYWYHFYNVFGMTRSLTRD